MKKIVGIIAAIILVPAMAFSITAKQVLRFLDRTYNIRSSYFKGRMIINKRGKKLTKDFNGYSQRNRRRGNKFFMAFTNPEDRGIKYLRIKDRMWIYFPDADDVMKISGHMLRRGMMGSDISYEDLLHFEDFDKKYRAVIKGFKKYKGRSCYDIEITARVPNVTYYKQRILVDRYRFVQMEMKMYAKSGRLLKKMTHSKIRRIGGFYFAMKIIVEDMRRKNSLTTVVYSQVRLNVYILPRTFTRRNLSR